MTERRTPRSGPGGSRRPGQRGSGRARPAAAAAPAAASRRPPEGSRFTGRAAILVLVVVVLAVSYASSMRAYLQQRAHIAEVKEQIAERRASIEDLEREKRRWQDEAFVQAQARERFGYLMPGETGYQVIDENGQPLDREDSLRDPADVAREQPTPWWDTAWESVEIAGDPPTAEERTPADKITPPEGSAP